MKDNRINEMSNIFGDSISKTWEKEELQLLQNAYDFATMAHKNVTRKGTDIPYITHPIEAACIAMTITTNVEAIARFETASYEAKIIALADKLSNLRSMDRDYKVIGEELWQRFHQKDKNEHGWYYKSMAEATKDLSGTDAWKEYKALCGTVFGE